ncbi:hypothetical protein ED312_14165 [Sinomicrobium pectinilyticum]|uniref:Uncharacterized protein n=1 Tax=Sinomicrobium pectinilyticum TaxID=1084421 RepID=A0A3N0E8A9_SINP1|nr:hypothetical protein ED312_14165 [Sinomicrobium pectinilyticum]
MNIEHDLLFPVPVFFCFAVLKCKSRSLPKPGMGDVKTRCFYLIIQKPVQINVFFSGLRSLRI